MFNTIILDIVNLFNMEPAAIASQIPNAEVGMVAKAYFGIDPKFLVRGKVFCPTPKIKIIIAVHNNQDIEKIMYDLVITNGTFALAFIIPFNLIETTDGNAATITRIVTALVTSYVETITNDAYTLLKQYDGGKAALVLYQAVPVLVTAIMRKLYVGPSLPLLISNTLKMDTSKYSDLMTEQWIDTIITLFDEGNTVDDLLDNGFICSVPPKSKAYPGIWPALENIDEDDQSNNEENSDDD